MQGKVVVVTGATSGIGAVAARSLAKQGARIVVVARDHTRGEQTLKLLRAISPTQIHAAHYADLSRLSEMKRVAKLIADSERRIDVLINNAGAMFATRQQTEDGLEGTFATNHMAYFVVTNLLLERLRATPGARIVSTASNAHKGSVLDFDDLQLTKAYDGLRAYGRSKLMNILFTRELARRLAGSGVTANCLHPGFVATRFGDSAGGFMSFAIKVAKSFAVSPEKGAQTIIYLAASPEVENVTGGYFYKCAPVTPSPEAQNSAEAQRLWEISAGLSGVGA